MKILPLVAGLAGWFLLAVLVLSSFRAPAPRSAPARGSATTVVRVEPAP